MDEEQSKTEALTPLNAAEQNPIITPSDPERYPLLEIPSQPCDVPFSNEDRGRLLMMDALLEGLGSTAYGVAAVQIGWPRQLFMLRDPHTGENEVYVNPTITRRSPETVRRFEGCLSLPGHSIPLARPKNLTLRYMDIEGNVQQREFSGMMARAVCHEMDHLNGLLINRPELVAGDMRRQANKVNNRITQRRNVRTKARAHRKRVRRQKRNAR